MKIIKKYVAVIIACVMFTGNLNIVKAEDGVCVDGSYLTTEESSEGVSQQLTKGVYLGSGSSSINKAGTGKIAAGGDTVGQTMVSKISVTVRVQRFVDGSWVDFTSWTATNYNSAYVSTSKYITVPMGSFYRVYCRHYANTDSSGSFTDGIYI